MSNQNTVYFKDLFKEYNESKLNYKLPIILGKDNKGKSQFADLTKLDHILITGETGSGKSIFEHSILATFLTLFSPDELGLFLVDMKRVDLTEYNDAKHLLTPVTGENEKVLAALNWFRDEKDRRLNPDKLSKKFNLSNENKPLVIIIDTFSDLVASHSETFQFLLAEVMHESDKSNIHVIMSDSRPSPEVFTPLIRNLFPTKICFNSSFKGYTEIMFEKETRNAKTIPGSMLFLPPDVKDPIKIQAPFISENEIKFILNEKIN